MERSVKMKEWVSLDFSFPRLLNQHETSGLAFMNISTYPALVARFSSAHYARAPKSQEFEPCPKQRENEVRPSQAQRRLRPRLSQPSPPQVA
jgi:hypothetical protein